MAATMERREATEFRVSGRRLEGYAATFGNPAKIGSFTEVIEPGAFRTSLLSGRDILALADHDPSKVLARTRSKTLTLSEDGKGLTFSLDVPDTQAGQDVLALAQRGDLGGMSFGFTATDEVWPSKDKRVLRSVQLFEISVVSAWPAYEGTVVHARSHVPVITPRLRLARLYMETTR